MAALDAEKFIAEHESPEEPAPVIETEKSNTGTEYKSNPLL
jgi:thioredoxin reductase (NADPH)